jgi:O-antigen ligase
MYLRKYTDFKYGNYLSVFFAIVTLLSGSRGSLIQIVLLFVLYISMDNNLFRMFFKLIVLALVGCIIVLALKNIPILYENIWVRFENLFSTMSGTELNDSSAMGRQFYKEIAFNMFKKKPILGWGVDGFVCYLLDNPEYNGYYIEAVYSHCNFSELSACFGLVGLLIWYVPTYVMFGHSVKSFRKSPFTEMTTYLLLSMVVLDFARIPWETHLSSYIYFVVFLIIFWVNVDIKKEEKNLLANAEVDNK